MRAGDPSAFALASTCSTSVSVCSLKCFDTPVEHKNLDWLVGMHTSREEEGESASLGFQSGV
jgi:hypothetical protein